MSKEALDLLGVLLREKPTSVTELAQLTGRAQSNISRSLQLLSRLRMVRLIKDGRGVRSEPLVKSVSLDLKNGTYQTTPILTGDAA